MRRFRAAPCFLAGLAVVLAACGTQTTFHSPAQPAGFQLFGTAAGAAAGGFAGAQIGSGSGQLAATAAGALIGAGLGASLTTQPVRTVSRPELVARPNTATVAGTIVGAAAGGLLGAQIGAGTGQLAATAAGTLIGAGIGGAVGGAFSGPSREGILAQRRAYPLAGRPLQNNVFAVPSVQVQVPVYREVIWAPVQDVTVSQSATFPAPHGCVFLRTVHGQPIQYCPDAFGGWSAVR